MSNMVYNMHRESDDSLENLANHIFERFNQKTIGSDLVVNKVTDVDNSKILLLMLEKYFFRTGSMACVTIQCISSKGVQNATIIGTGGGTGILNFSFGANSSFANQAQAILEEIGFENIEN